MRNRLLAAIVLMAIHACGRPGGGDGSSKRVVIQSKGSDTLVQVAQAWAEAYRDVDPNVAVAVTGGGTGTGIAALINGTADIANASRTMTDKELDLARSNGAEPVEFVVGYDGLAVYLHKDNPLESITLGQLAEIYGDDGKVTRWTDLGVEVPGCQDQEIVVVSRQNNSGTYVYFREAVLGEERDFRLGTRDMHGSKDVVDLVEHTACAIGYSGLAYANPNVKMACISKAEGEPCVTPSMATAADGSYPISRPLFMYTKNEPEGVLKGYVDWILSEEGQCIIHDKGYSPVGDVDCSKG